MAVIEHDSSAHDVKRSRIRPLRALTGALFITVSVSIVHASGAFASQSSLQNQASTLAAQILSQGTQLHAIAVEENAAQQALVNAKAAVATTRSTLLRDQAILRTRRTQLSHAVIDEFVTGTNVSALITFLASSEQVNLVKTEYQNIAVSNINDDLRRVQVAQASEHAAQQLLAVHVQQATSALSQVQTAKASLQSAITKEQASLTSVNAQLQSDLQAALAAKAKQHVTQGLPSPTAIATVAAGPARTSQWGGTPAPPSPAAFAALRDCESGGNYQDNTGNGYYGAYQFSASTWSNLGFSGLPNQAPPAVQDEAAAKLESSGWGSWPACAAILGLD